MNAPSEMPADELLHMLALLAKTIPAPSRIDRRDLYQAGFIGLMKAIKRYDPAKGASLKHWAEICARGAMLDYLRWAGEWRSQEKIEPPVLVPLGQQNGYVTLPLARLADRRTRADILEARIDVRHLLALLPRRWKMLVRRHYLEEVTLDALARELGVSEGRVCQIMRSALGLMRRCGRSGSVEAARLSAHQRRNVDKMHRAA